MKCSRGGWRRGGSRGRTRSRSGVANEGSDIPSAGPGKQGRVRPGRAGGDALVVLRTEGVVARSPAGRIRGWPKIVVVKIRESVDGRPHASRPGRRVCVVTM